MLTSPAARSVSGPSYYAGHLTTPKSGKVRAVPRAPDVASALAQLGWRERSRPASRITPEAATSATLLLGMESSSVQGRPSSSVCIAQSHRNGRGPLAL